MAKTWKITRWDGLESKVLRMLPGHMAESEIATVLQRLVCQRLNDDEILCASLRMGAKDYSSLLERHGHGAPMSYGENPHYTAEIEN